MHVNAYKLIIFSKYYYVMRGDISWREAARNAQDRDKWKSVVCGLYPEIGISGSLLFVAYILR